MKYDWLRDYEDEGMEPMEMDAAERERVLQNALGKLAAQPSAPSEPPEPEGRAKKPAQRRRKRRFSRIIGILAAVFAAGLLTAGATGLFDVAGTLYLIFGTPADPEMIEALGVAAYPIRQSQTQGGYTVTLEGVLGDRNSCYIVFNVAAPEGVPLDAAYGYGFRRYDIWPESPLANRSCGYFVGQLPDDDHTDNVIRFMYSYDGEAILPGKTFCIALQTLVAYVDDGEGDGEWDNEKTVADETWEFTFRMEYKDVSLRVPVHEAEPFRDTEVRLTSIYVSPLSIRLEYRRPVLQRLLDRETDLSGEEQSERMAWVTKQHPVVVLHFRDGSQLAVGMDEEGRLYGGMSGSSNSSGITRLSASYSFDRPINTAELVSMDVDGVNYPVH